MDSHCRRRDVQRPPVISDIEGTPSPMILIPKVPAICWPSASTLCCVEDFLPKGKKNGHDQVESRTYQTLLNIPLCVGQLKEQAGVSYPWRLYQGENQKFFEVPVQLYFHLASLLQMTMIAAKRNNGAVCPCIIDFLKIIKYQGYNNRDMELSYEPWKLLAMDWCSTQH